MDLSELGLDYNKHTSVLNHFDIWVEVGIGDVDVTTSREEITYDDRAKKLISELLIDCVDKYRMEFVNEFNQLDTVWSKMKFVNENKNLIEPLQVSLEYNGQKLFATLPVYKVFHHGIRIVIPKFKDRHRHGGTNYVTKNMQHDDHIVAHTKSIFVHMDCVKKSDNRPRLLGLFENNNQNKYYGVYGDQSVIDELRASLGHDVPVLSAEKDLADYAVTKSPSVRINVAPTAKGNIVDCDGDVHKITDANTYTDILADTTKTKVWIPISYGSIDNYATDVYRAIHAYAVSLNTPFVMIGLTEAKQKKIPTDFVAFKDFAKSLIESNISADKLTKKMPQVSDVDSENSIRSIVIALDRYQLTEDVFTNNTNLADCIKQFKEIRDESCSDIYNVLDAYWRLFGYPSIQNIDAAKKVDELFSEVLTQHSFADTIIQNHLGYRCTRKEIEQFITYMNS